MPNDLQQTATPERTPTGRVWMDLCLKHYQAGRNGDEACRQALGVIMAALEAEQPNEIAAEREFWGGATNG